MRASPKKKENGQRRWYIQCRVFHYSRTRVHTRKRRGERSSGEPRFSEEIFPGSHFPGGLARSDSSLVFRRDFIAEKSAFERGRLQVATASRTIPSGGTCVRVYVRVCVRKCHETLRHYFYFFFSFARKTEEKRIRVGVPHRGALATIREKKSHTAEKSKSAITRYFRAFAKHRVETAIKGE